MEMRMQVILSTAEDVATPSRQSQTRIWQEAAVDGRCY